MLKTALSLAAVIAACIGTAVAQETPADKATLARLDACGNTDSACMMRAISGDEVTVLRGNGPIQRRPVWSSSPPAILNTLPLATLPIPKR